MTEVFADREFLALRLREWTLLRTIALGKPWAAEKISTSASDWFQRTATTMRFVVSPEAPSLLAERGRTRRVRNAASGQLQRRPGPAQLTSSTALDDSSCRCGTASWRGAQGLRVRAAACCGRCDRAP